MPSTVWRVRPRDRREEACVRRLWPSPEGSGGRLHRYGSAVRVEEEIHVTEGRLLGRDAELRGRLRVSTIDFIFAGFPDVFESFIQRYPGVDVTVGVTNEQVSLIRREADVALRLGNSAAQRLVGRRVGRLQFEAYAARSL